MLFKVAVCGFVCFSLLITKVFTLHCYTCSSIGITTCSTVMHCEEVFPELAPHYVCTKVITTYIPEQGPNVTSMELGCGRPDSCERMDENNLPYDVCEICTENRCNGSVSLHGSFYVISTIVLLSVILTVQRK